MLRLSTALARLRNVPVVEKADVNEAMRLMEQSKDSLLREEGDGAGRRAESVVDRIYKVIREIASGDGRKSLKVSQCGFFLLPPNENIHTQNVVTLQVSEIKERCMSKGFKPDQIDECIEEYEELNVWSVNQTKTKITFVD